MFSNQINQIFEKFIRENLYPKPEERAFISEKYHELKDTILPSDIHVFRGGSYARGTANTPVWDLDVFCDLENPTEYLPTLLQILQNAYKGRANIEEQTHSIGIYFWAHDEFSIDVVPVRKAKEMPKNEFKLYLYELPEFTKHSKKWRKAFYGSNAVSLSDPEGYREKALEVDGQSGWRFKKVVKFLKRWNYGMKQEVNDVDFISFKSFHLEEIIKRYYIDNPSLWVGDAIVRFYNEGMNFLQEPQFLDRAAKLSGQHFYIDEYVRGISSESKKKIQEYLTKWIEHMELVHISSDSDVEDIARRLLFMAVPRKELPKYTTVPKHSWAHFML